MLESSYGIHSLNIHFCLQSGVKDKKKVHLDITRVSQGDGDRSDCSIRSWLEVTFHHV